ncbi:MAG: glutamate--tRNA ligase [Pyrinomonadaceae bacterium]
MITRVRFAPSPTGYLHIGSARTALFNYLYARHTGGKFLLRIEDTDIARSTEESTRSILDGLAWLELEHDEEIVFQSDNADKHRTAAFKLLEEGKAYRDFTPKAEPSDANVKDAIKDRARAGQGIKNMRDNPYRDIPEVESDTRTTNGEPFAIRLKVATHGRTAFDDAVYGIQERNYADTEDLVLLRSDGHPLYNLAVVCDDIEMKITHVIRGQDHLTNTHKQILIYEALGVTPPTFAHLPLILAPNKGKLSKRKHGEVVSMTTYRDAGFLSLPFVNFLLRLGWSQPQDTAELLSDGQAAETPLYLSDNEIGEMRELIEVFDLDGVKKSPAIFTFVEGDPKHWTDDKAIFFNAEYIRTMPLAELLPLVKAELKAAKLWRDEYEDEDAEARASARAKHEPEPNDKLWFEKTTDLIRQRFFTLKDFSSQGRAYFSEDYDFDAAAIEKNLNKFPDLKTWLPELADRFESMDSFTEPEIEEVVKAFTEEKGTKLGVIMNGARTLLTGVAVGPSMLSVFETLGKEKSVLRLRSQIGWNI